MRIRFPLFWIILVLLIAYGQDDTSNADNFPVEETTFAEVINQRMQRKFGLTEKVQRELAILQHFTKIDDDAINRLKLKLKPLIQKTYEDHPELIALRVPPDEILDVLVESAKKIADQESLVKYREDLDARRTFDTTMAMQSYVYHVDSYVGLSDEQWEPIRQICAKLYRQGDCLRTCIDTENSDAERKQLSETLTESQLGYLQKFKPKWTGGDEPENLAPAMREIAEMRVRQVDAVVQLTPEQRTKLQFAAKRTMIPSAVERKIKIKADFKDLAMTLGGMKPKTLTNKEIFDAWNLHGASIPFFFAEHRWEKFIAATLTPDQINKWTRFTDRRREAAIDVEAFNLGDYLAPLPLTSEQQIAAHNLLKRSIQAKGATLESAFATMNNPSSIPAMTTQQEFVAAIGEDNWSKLDDFTKRVLPTKRKGE